MVGQYFKRKREFVEIIVVAGTGLGILLMSIAVHMAIRSLTDLSSNPKNILITLIKAL